MNTSSIAYAAPESAEKSFMDELLTALNNLEPGHFLTLEENHPLYVAPVDSIWLPASDLLISGNTDSVTGRPASFIDLYTLDGRLVPADERPEGWFDSEKANELTRSEASMMNAVHRLGDRYIVIGRGFWTGGRSKIDGELYFEFISDAEAMRRDRAELAEHLPLVLRNKPEWAEEPKLMNLDIDRDNTESGVVEIEVRYWSPDFLPESCEWDAELQISSYVVMDVDGNVLRSEPPKPYIYIAEQREIDSPPMTAADIYRIAEGMADLATKFREVQESTVGGDAQ